MVSILLKMTLVQVERLKNTVVMVLSYIQYSKNIFSAFWFDVHFTICMYLLKKVIYASLFPHKNHNFKQTGDVA